MGKIILILLLLVLSVAYFTRPDDKTCIIEGTKAVWGDRVPDVQEKPALFEQFMDINSPSVQVKDWFFFKQVKYKVTQGQQTVALGAFGTVFPMVKPVEKRAIPEMPAQSKR